MRPRLWILALIKKKNHNSRTGQSDTGRSAQLTYLPVYLNQQPSGSVRKGGILCRPLTPTCLYAHAHLCIHTHKYTHTHTTQTHVHEEEIPLIKP